MEKIAREQAEPRTDTLVWGKNAVTELLKSGGAYCLSGRLAAAAGCRLLHRPGQADRRGGQTGTRP